MPRRGQIVFVRGPAEASGLPASLEAESLLLGRGSDSDIRLSAPAISRLHAEIVWEGERLILIAHSTTSATEVNGVRVERSCELADGDLIELASAVVLRVELPAVDAPSEAASAAAAREASPKREPAPTPAPPEAPGPAAARAPTPDAGSGPARIAIVGAGPAGIAAAVQAAKRGVAHVLLERGRLAETIERYQKGKFVMDEPTRLSLHPELEVGFEAGAREEVLATWQQAVARAGVELRCGREFEVVEIQGRKGAFQLLLRGGAKIEATHVVLAIGVQGNLRSFGVPGDDLPHVTYQLDDPAAYEGKRVAIVGVGDAGIENALALAAHDNDVFIVNRRDEFARAKARNRALVEAAIKSGQIAHCTHSTVDHFEPGAVVLRTQQGQERLEVDLVIGRLGGNPPRDFLQSLGVQFPSEDAEAVPELSASYETNVPGIHVIGALAGYPLIKNCMNQGFEAVEHILGRPVTPADEPVLREKFKGIKGSVSEILERIRRRVPIFRELTQVQLREFLFDAEVKQLKAGELVYRRNDYTNEFYAVLAGKVALEEPAQERDVDVGKTIAFTRTLLAQDIQGYAREVPTGSFFGETELFSGRRRGATARALEPSLLLEAPRLAIARLLQSTPAVQRAVDAVFIERTLEKRLPELSPDERAALAASAEIRQYPPNQILFKEGDAPDGLHLIRRGSVAIQRTLEGRERIMQYLQTGAWLGVMGVLAPAAGRRASARAKVLTETLLLPQAALLPLLEAKPRLRAGLERCAREDAVWDAMEAASGGGTMIFMLEQSGAFEATDLLLIDESLCVRCNNCEKACAETHLGLSRLDREAGPTYQTSSGAQLHVPTACQHCENPKCMEDCPPDAIRRHANGEVYIKDNCIACGNCMNNCPYGVIRIATVEPYQKPGLLRQLLFGAEAKRGGGTHAEGASHSDAAVKCDLCQGLPQPSRGGTRAACVAACPTGAIVRVDPKNFLAELVTRR